MCEKVYCKNCRYNGGIINLFTIWSWCESPHLSYNAGNIFIGDPVRIHKKAEFKKLFNSEGECPHYKRKWYVFWIKE